MTTSSAARPSTTVLAIVPIILFIPTLISFAVSEPGVVWPQYTGVLFHLAILLLIAGLDAPSWAKAAGYGWIILDVLTGILSINGVPPEYVLYPASLLLIAWFVLLAVANRTRRTAGTSTTTPRALQQPSR
jgi:hypothetical protein